MIDSNGASGQGRVFVAVALIISAAAGFLTFYMFELEDCLSGLWTVDATPVDW